MNDQAAGLRTGSSKKRDTHGFPQLNAIAMTGGKGGVGKTSLAVNLSVLLAKMDLRPLLIDLDMGLANADVLLGINPLASLFEVVITGKPLDEAIVETHGIGFVPAASGRDELTRLSYQQFAGLLQQFARAAQKYDLLILDTAAGISREVTTFLRTAKVVTVVITPDPTSLTDAYALIKVLEQQQPGKDIRIIVNQVRSDDEAQLVFQKMKKVTQSYLQRDVTLLGHVPSDPLVVDAVRARSPYAMRRDCEPTRHLQTIATRLAGLNWQCTLGL